ncbi:DUF2147 domain-containing protein, partial [Sandarakinorhabdus sp.]|uniref:DUF2147 domain-containing protein n=1 Tax=Sandarakinorhabdus sp. TaxID=1916663 RepID=UPI0033408AEC
HLLTALLAAMIGCGAGTAQAATYGVFRNPSGSVQVRLADCGALLCGTIVAASRKARADAADAGQTRLIGMQLFRNMTRAVQPKTVQLKTGQPGAAGQRWEGQVYIPDKDRVVSGTATLNGRTLKVEGCLLGDALCKSQDWTRTN